MSETDKAITAVTLLAESLESTFCDYSMAAKNIRTVLAEIDRLKKLEKAVNAAD